MFCACVGILICLGVIITGAVISSVDVVRYDFGLYYVLLAIVCLMGALTLCVIRPTKFCGISDPRWYTNICESIHRALLNAQEKRLAAQLDLELAESGSTVTNGPTNTSKRTAGAPVQRATLMMLGPAVELMHHVIHGVAESKDDEETEDKSSIQEAIQPLWWDTYVPVPSSSPERKPKRPKRKKRRRAKLVKCDLPTIKSVSIELGSIVTTQPQNGPCHMNLQLPEYNGCVEDGTSEVFL